MGFHLRGSCRAEWGWGVEEAKAVTQSAGAPAGPPDNGDIGHRVGTCLKVGINRLCCSVCVSQVRGTRQRAHTFLAMSLPGEGLVGAERVHLQPSEVPADATRAAGCTDLGLPRDVVSNDPRGPCCSVLSEAQRALSGLCWSRERQPVTGHGASFRVTD